MACPPGPRNEAGLMIFARNALASGPGKALKLNRLYAYLAKSEGGHPLKERRKFSEILQGDLPSVALVPGPQPRHSGNVNPPSAIGGDPRQSRGFTLRNLFSFLSFFILKILKICVHLRPILIPHYPKTPPMREPARRLINHKQKAPRMIRISPRAAASLTEPPM
jgi:hypothetical protein